MFFFSAIFNLIHEINIFVLLDLLSLSQFNKIYGSKEKFSVSVYQLGSFALGRTQ